jgi:hypothetical protein
MMWRLQARTRAVPDEIVVNVLSQEILFKGIGRVRNTLLTVAEYRELSVLIQLLAGKSVHTDRRAVIRLGSNRNREP